MRRARLIAAALFVSAACSRRPDVPILTYHSISAAPDAFTVSEQRFADELDALRSRGFQTVTFHEWLAHLEQKTPLPSAPIILTFDDGYEDAYTTVLPALRARRMRAVFFIVTSFVGADESHRTVRDEDGIRRRYLVWPEIRGLAAAGMEIGSHSVSHRRFADLTGDEVQSELKRSKQGLEDALGRGIEVFSYPYNSVRRWMEPLVRDAGYRAAAAGTVHGSADRFALYRMGVFRSTTTEALLSQLPHPAPAAPSEAPRAQSR
ncbi:MAG TPA: polysaccharide deacetylase family protein [Myxococcales bacterium]|nr:polysaccharide deacetylase family protein [Myxococcales bacterium]